MALAIAAWVLTDSLTKKLLGVVTAIAPWVLVRWWIVRTQTTKARSERIKAAKSRSGLVVSAPAKPLLREKCVKIPPMAKQATQAVASVANALSGAPKPTETYASSTDPIPLLAQSLVKPTSGSQTTESTKEPQLTAPTAAYQVHTDSSTDTPNGVPATVTSENRLVPNTPPKPVIPTAHSPPVHRELGGSSSSEQVVIKLEVEYLLATAALTRKTPPSSPSQPIIDLIKEIAGTGEIVSLTYSHGSRRGQARDLSIISLLDDESAIKVREDDYPDEKTYVVKRIMQIETQEGKVARNDDTVTRFHESRLKYERERQKLVNICEWGSAAELKDCRFEVSKVASGYMLWNKLNFKQATIQARDIESARRAAFAIELMLTHSSGYWWEIQEVMVRGRIYWPKWMTLQEAAYLDGQRIANQFETEHPGHSWSQQPFHARCDAYTKSPLWRPHDWHYLDWGRIFEAGRFDMEGALRWVAHASISREEYKEYILGSNGPQTPIALPNHHISDKTLTKLLEKGLAKPSEGPSLESILSSYKVNLLRTMAKQWGVVTTGVKKTDLVQICINAMPGDEALHLIADHTRPNLFLLQPPKGLDPDQFQDFKSCYRQMFAMLTSWIDGDLECTETVAKILG